MKHWYDSDGRLHTTVINQAAVKRGDDNTGRNATIKDARKNGWFPGWTAIGGMLDKPALNAWKKAEFKRVMEEEPRCGDDETWAEYWRRIEEKLRHELEKYAELGSKVHGWIEDLLDPKWEHERNEINTPWLKMFEQWRDRNVSEVIASEMTFCSPEWGYGGTIDLQYTNWQDQFAIADFKTKRTKPGEKVIQYNENKRQLVAYALGIRKIEWGVQPAAFGPEDANDSRCFFKDSFPVLGNLYLSTTEPGRWEYIEVKPEEIPNLILDVRDLTRLWQRENKFNMKG